MTTRGTGPNYGMAIRLGEHVRSGTIDNSIRGRVTGELFLEGLDCPLRLDLKGNAHPDLAGCILTFRNEETEPIDPELAQYLQREQTGLAGDMSAAEKRKILNLSLEEFSLASEQEREAGTTWKTVLFLEWFSHYNGRIVIEAVDYEWEIDLPRWQLSEEDRRQQAEQAKAAMDMHLNFAVEMFQETNEEIRAAEEEIDPMANDEFAWERRLQQSDRRAEAFHALMEEARTPEEMEALAEMAYGDEEEDIFEEEDEGDFLDEGYTRDQYEADEEVRQICSSIQELCKILIKNRYDEMIGLPEQGEFLSLMVKSQTAADMTAGENSGFERGFLIAHVKREIARSQHIISGLRAFSEEKEQQLVEEIWKLRDLLIQLAGKLRA